MKPYGLGADFHLHPWSAFSTVNPEGVNSRLDELLNEIRRIADEVQKAGGNKIVIAGDIFHVRGSLAPLVLNPVKDCFRDLINDGFEIELDAGNHDAELKDVSRLSSAITALEDVGCKVINHPTYASNGDGNITFTVPWYKTVAELKAVLEATTFNREETDLIIHAPIDDVIPGLPDHGLDAAYLASLGFKRVFSGHYHHHKDFGNGVYSIGALAHHTWSDVKSKAGFMIVHDDKVEWFKSHLPEFIEVDSTVEEDELPLIVDGNYVRAKLNTTKQKDIEETRAYLMSLGAKGVTIVAQKELSEVKRTGSTVTAGATLDVSVEDYIKGQSHAREKDLSILCSEILNEARAVEVA